ncbi:MAG: hypothetical protein IKT79_01880, partial [Akkermansia sp.]|nr:hypothetical protein [Akkermansia sp.]
MLHDVSKAELRLCSRLGLSEASSAHLVQAMRAGSSARSAIVLTPKAPADYRPPFACEDTAAWGWLPPRVYLPCRGERPTTHPDYEAGLYYSLDVSSCWESAALARIAAPSASL